MQSATSVRWISRGLLGLALAAGPGCKNPEKAPPPPQGVGPFATAELVREADGSSTLQVDLQPASGGSPRGRVIVWIDRGIPLDSITTGPDLLSRGTVDLPVTLSMQRLELDYGGLRIRIAFVAEDARVWTVIREFGTPGEFERFEIFRGELLAPADMGLLTAISAAGYRALLRGSSSFRDSTQPFERILGYPDATIDPANIEPGWTATELRYWLIEQQAQPGFDRNPAKNRAFATLTDLALTRDSGDKVTLEIDVDEELATARGATPPTSAWIFATLTETNAAGELRYWRYRSRRALSVADGFSALDKRLKGSMTPFSEAPPEFPANDPRSGD